MFSEKKSDISGNLGRLSGIEDDETLGALLVHDPVAALPAPDRVLGPNLVLTEIQDNTITYR